MKKLIDSLFSVQNIITLLVLLGTIVFWFYKIDNLPTKVENHEARIVALEHTNVELKTKVDLTLAAVYEIRSIMLKKDWK